MISVIDAISENALPDIETLLNSPIYKDARFIGIDFMYMPVFDSSMVGNLVQLLKHVGKKNIRLVLFNLNMPVLKFFEITKLNQYFLIDDTDDNDRYPWTTSFYSDKTNGNLYLLNSVQV